MSLVLKLQSAALDSSSRLSDVLRVALTVAMKLDHDRLRDWTNRELGGYGKEPVPLYRKVSGRLLAHNPSRGWIPVIMEDSAMQAMLSQRDIGQPIAELEAINSSKRKDNLQVPLPHDWLLKFFGNTEAFRLGIIPTLVIPHADVAGILDSVRNVALQWSLSLEKEGVVGDDMRFSQDEVARARTVPFDVDRLLGHP